MLDRGLALFGIGLVFGGGFGFLAAAGMGVTLDGHDHATGHGGAGHEATHAQPVEAVAGQAPSVALTADADPVSGWNVRVETANFRFAPEHAGQGDVPGEGHVHLTLNGEKVARVYSEWVHLDRGAPGDTLRAAIYTNDHHPLTKGGQPVEASVTLGR